MILAKKRFSKYRNTNTLRQRPPRCSKYRNTNTLERRHVASLVPTLHRFTEKKNAFFCKKDLAKQKKVCYNIPMMSTAQIDRLIEVNKQKFRAHNVKLIEAERTGNMMDMVRADNGMRLAIEAIENLQAMKA